MLARFRQGVGMFAGASTTHLVAADAAMELCVGGLRGLPIGNRRYSRLETCATPNTHNLWMHRRAAEVTRL
jgi:hypothetical protein